MRQWLSRAGRGRVVALLALALVVRALVPVGWMPVATADGLAFALCPSQGAPPRAMAMHHGGSDQGDADHGKAAAPDHSCAFAGLGLAADRAPPPPLLAPLPAGAPSSARVVAVAVGRGLAAPPPPSTGPPAFA